LLDGRSGGLVPVIAFVVARRMVRSMQVISTSAVGGDLFRRISGMMRRSVFGLIVGTAMDCGSSLDPKGNSSSLVLSLTVVGSSMTTFLVRRALVFLNRFLCV
jgi:hypothetical protein